MKNAILGGLLVGVGMVCGWLLLGAMAPKPNRSTVGLDWVARMNRPEARAARSAKRDAERRKEWHTDELIIERDRAMARLRELNTPLPPPVRVDVTIRGNK